MGEVLFSDPLGANIREAAFMKLLARSGRTVGVSALLAGLLALGAPVAPARQDPAPQEAGQPLRYELSVVLKLINVYVTDKKGDPILDLTKDDFAVIDNGNPVTLSAFERHRLASPAPAAEAAEAMPAAEKAPPAETKTPATNRKFFLFFDMAFNNARGLTKAKTAALHFLDAQARPDDEIGVLSYSMFKGVSVHEFLTADHGKVRKVLDSIDQRGIAGRASEIEDWYWRLVQEPLPSGTSTLGDVTLSYSPAQSQQYMKEAQGQREESKKIAQTFILRMTALAKALRYVPGQKQFILFSSGVPASLIYGSQAGNPNDLSGRAAFDAGDRTIRTQNEEMYKEFAASGCSFYAFDTRESATVIDLFGYDRETFETGGRGLFGAQGLFQDSTNTFRDDKTTGLNSLKRFTDITGGKYYSNINRYEKNLNQVQTLTGTYYVLGYSIGEQWDGRFHEVKVECKRKGCEVRAAAGYFNPKPYKEYTALEKQLHLFDLALNERSFSRLPVRFPLTALAYPAGKETRLEIVAKVPADVLARFSGGKAEFIAVVFDGQDEIQDVRRLECDPTRQAGRAVVFAAGTAPGPGDYKCRLVLRDMETGMSAVASAKGIIAAPANTGLTMGTPLLLAGANGAALLDAGPAKKTDAVTWSDAYPFDAAGQSPAIEPVPRSAGRVLILVPCSRPEGGSADLAVSASLVRSDTGAKVPAAFALAGRTARGPLEVLTVELDLGELAAGPYLLFVYAEDPATKARSYARAALTIVNR
jgi:VWFA-related protein